MTYDVNLGIGNATGMFYHATAGTALPDYPSATLAAAWKEVGAISEDGISFNPNRTFEKLKDWAKRIARTLPSEDSGEVKAPVLDTTEESLKTVLGADNVEVTPASGSHGKLIKADLEVGGMPGAEAYLFLMKDGDDILMLGTTKGYITEVAEVSFAPNDAITWEATITADKWVFAKECGSNSSSS